MPKPRETPVLMPPTRRRVQFGAGPVAPAQKPAPKPAPKPATGVEQVKPAPAEPKHEKVKAAGGGRREGAGDAGAAGSVSRTVQPGNVRGGAAGEIRGGSQLLLPAA